MQTENAPQLLNNSPSDLPTSWNLIIRENPNCEDKIAATILKICQLHLINEQSQPSLFQLTEMAQQVIKYHSKYSLSEIYKACELNQNNKLEKKIEHFQKFSISYLSDVLAHYDEYKRDEKRRQDAKIQPVQSPLEIGYNRNKAMYDALANWCIATRKIPYYWDWSKVFQYLFDSKQLTELTKEKMMQIYDQFKAKGISESVTGRFSATTLGKAMDFNQLTKDESIKLECRKFVVEEYLRKEFQIN